MSLNHITSANRIASVGLEDRQPVFAKDYNTAVDQINTNTTDIATLQTATTNLNYVVADVIVATSTSTTTDFASLVTGDKVLVLPVAAGTPANTTGSYFKEVATDGTLPAAAVVGNVYVVLRAA